MRLLSRIIEIVTKKDIDWMELFVGFITVGFCFCLLAPGDYFASTPRLRPLEHIGPHFTIPKLFWLAVFVTLGLIQAVAVSAGGKAIAIPLSRTKVLSLNPYLIRMRVLAVGAGVWFSIAVLAFPSVPIWYIHLAPGLPTIPVFVALSEWLFSGLFLFSVIAALRMAAKWSVERQQNRRQEVIKEAEQLASLFADVAGIYSDEHHGQRIMK